MNTTVDILINPVTLRFSYHNSELIYMFASHPEQQLDEMEKLMGVTTDDGPIFDTNVGFLPVASTTLIRGEKNILVDPGNYHIGFYSILKRALASKNLTYEDIDIVATTHTHSDHAASIVHFRNKPWIIGSKEFDDMVAIEGKEIVDAKKSMMGEIIENVKKFGLPVAIAVNHFIKDTDDEVKALVDFCNKLGIKASLCTHWANGGEGTKELASHVADLCEKNENKFKFLYESKTPLFKKIETIAKEIYRADEVIADTKIRDQLKSFEEAGYGELPICVAKTQYSFSTDPNLKGAPTGHSLPIREIRLSSGAEFIVVVCGAIMTMPGLPRVPAADSIKLNKKGEIEGLF